MNSETERLISWLAENRIAVLEVAGAAVGYGGALDRSRGGAANRIRDCVASFTTLPPLCGRVPLSRAELEAVCWDDVLEAVVAIARRLPDDPMGLDLAV